MVVHDGRLKRRIGEYIDRRMEVSEKIKTRFKGQAGRNCVGQEKIRA
jgi:hypothetical protein